MTDQRILRRVGLELGEEELGPLPAVSEEACRGTALASFLRTTFTRPDGRLEARSGAVLLDEDGKPRGVTAPFGGEWPHAQVQAAELFATARKSGWLRLVLFRMETDRHVGPGITFQFSQDMRALGLLFGVEVVDLLFVRPGRHWCYSKAPLLRHSLHCEVTLSRALHYMIACAFERFLAPIGIEASTEGGAPLRWKRLVEGPWPRGSPETG